MASSWWEFGEHSGYKGDEVWEGEVTCGFCNEKGNFERVHHTDRSNPTGKKLNYDIWKCINCANLTMVFWSGRGRGPDNFYGLHDFSTLPPPLVTTRFPDHWPPDVGRYWLQARRSLEGMNWDAAALMARSAIQLVARLQNATGRNLKEQIDDLAKRGVLLPSMQEWSHEVRELGNDSAHPTPGATGPTSKDAQDIVRFLTMLLTMIYNLPHEIAQYRARKSSEAD